MDEMELLSPAYFNISEVAQQIGVTAGTIRNWEKAGLFVAKRSPKGYRQFSLNDIEKLKRIKNHSAEYFNPSNTQEEIEKRESADHDVQFLMSLKWKECRQKKRFRLNDVAKDIGISPAYLSRIENAKANASLEVLQKLADYYGENLLFYIKDSGKNNHLVHSNEGEIIDIGVPGITMCSKIELANHTLSALLYTAAPGCGRSNPHGHSGEEFVYVLYGELEFTLNETETYVIHTGDSFAFRSSSVHSWKNNGTQMAIFLWVYTPITKI